MSDSKYIHGIRKTGFILENKVSDVLRRAGWTVISNKYYEDDFEGSVREIDLLAYKVSKVQQVWLKENPAVRSSVKAAFEQVYRYVGDFRFESNDVPF